MQRVLLLAALLLACGDPIAPSPLTVTSSCFDWSCTIVTHYPGTYDHLYSMEGRALTLRGEDSIWAPWAWTRLFPKARDSSVFPLDFLNARSTVYHLKVAVDGTTVTLDYPR